jgi:hypothetical protein
MSSCIAVDSPWHGKWTCVPPFNLLGSAGHRCRSVALYVVLSASLRFGPRKRRYAIIFYRLTCSAGAVWGKILAHVVKSEFYTRSSGTGRGDRALRLTPFAAHGNAQQVRVESKAELANKGMPALPFWASRKSSWVWHGHWR